MIPHDNYLSSALKEFNYYKSLADKTIAQLNREQLYWRPNQQSNSVAMLIRHMTGNMRSRFTNFLTEDGEKSWRNRDSEFEEHHETKEELLTRWEEGWKILLQEINALTEKDLKRTVTIRNEPHSVIQAINRQIAHYSYHVGQIVFIGKCLVDNWISLSIPLHGSEAFNRSRNQPS